MGLFDILKKKTKIKSYIVIDIETTGLSRKNDRIIEIAADRYHNGEITEQYHTYVNPGVPIPPHITRLTGITDKMVKDAPSIQQIKQDFLSFIGMTHLVGHNLITFDIPFLREQTGLPINNEVTDTLHLAKKVFPDLPSYKLSFLDQALHLGFMEHHRAQNDILITNALYLACQEPRKYQKYLADKQAISQIPVEPKRKGYHDIDIHTIVPKNPNAQANTPLTGKNIVFSGVFSMPIEEAMQIAVDAGAMLKSSVSRKVNYLVVGWHRPEFMDENGMTTKQRTATKLNSEGQANIQIIDEATFLEMANTTNA